MRACVRARVLRVYASVNGGLTGELGLDLRFTRVAGLVAGLGACPSPESEVR